MAELSRSTSDIRKPGASLAVLEIAARKWGVVTWRQLRELGLGEATISRWTAAGRLHRIHPGVYALGHRQFRDEGWLAAALLYAGRGAALSHVTAAWWTRVVQQRPSELDVSTPSRRSSLDGLNLHHPRNLERTFHRGLPITRPERTLVDIAPRLPTRQLRRALAETLYRRLATPDQIRSAMKRGQPGSGRLRAALDAHLPQFARSRSDMEDAFLELCERFGLPIPALNEPAEGFTVDAVWRAERVAAELDSELGHGVPGTVHRDRARDLRLRAAGWTVMRYSWRQVLHEPEQVAHDLAAALASREPRQDSTATG